ncbi:hypothetical protein AAC387_Pa01g3155 [Persea americana]
MRLFSISSAQNICTVLISGSLLAMDFRTLILLLLLQAHILSFEVSDLIHIGEEEEAEGVDCEGAESDFRSAAELFSNFFSFLAFTGIISEG